MKKQMGKIRIAVQLLAGILLVVGGFSNLPVTLLIILVSTVLAGPFFCGWVCPFGTLQDLVSRLTPWVKKLKMPKVIQKGLAISRYVLMAVTTLLATDFVFSLLQLDPRINLLSVLDGKILTIGAYIVLVLYLVVSVFFERPFCNYMCPQGAKYGLLSTLRPFRVISDTETCVKCDKCNQVCPMNIDIMGHDNVKSLQCINCMSCVSTCPKKGALKFGVIKLNRRSAIAYFIAVAVILATSTVAMAIQFTSNQAELEAAEAQATEELQGQEDNTQINAQSQSTEVQTNTAETTTSDNAETTTSDNTGTSTPSSTASNNSSTTSKKTTSSSNTTTSNNTNTSTTTASSTQSQTTAAPQASQTSKASQTQTTAASSSTAANSSVTTTQTAAVPKGAAAGIADGTYTGVGTGFRGEMTVAVTVKDQQITSVEVVSHSDDRKWFNRAVSMVPNWIIEAQSTDVDTVSGATYSSLGIINAAKNALSNAK